MPPMSSRPIFTCATCEATVTARPTFHLGLAFCCAGCAADGPCMCSYDHEVPDVHDGSSIHDDALAADAGRLVGAAS